MTVYFFSRRARTPAQAMMAAALLGSLSGCANFTDHVEGAPPASAVTSARDRTAPGEPVTKKEEGEASPASALDSQLAGLNRQIEGRKEYNARLRDLVTAKERQLASVLASDRSAGPAAQEFDLRTSVNSEVGKIDRASRSWQETIDAHKAVLKGASTDARGPELEAEINRLAEERAELLRQRARLISINEKLVK